MCCALKGCIGIGYVMISREKSKKKGRGDGTRRKYIQRIQLKYISIIESV